MRACHRRPLSDAEAVTMAGDPDLGRRVAVVRSVIPAVTHVDYSARVQTVDAGRHPRLHRLLRSFHRLTGCPLLAAADLRAPGEPLVCARELLGFDNLPDKLFEVAEEIRDNVYWLDLGTTGLFAAIACGFCIYAALTALAVARISPPTTPAVP